MLQQSRVTQRSEYVIPSLKRTKLPRKERLRLALDNPAFVEQNLCCRSFYYFLTKFWPQVSNDAFQPNWHIGYLCNELEKVARRVAEKKSKLYDLIINIPPGSTKTIIISIMFPVWCWIQWHWMRFIAVSYSAAVSLESAEYCRDLVRSKEFDNVFPYLRIKQDKDTKSNFRLQKFVVNRVGKTKQVVYGGNRFSTSVGGSLTGFHGHILIVDDPLNPEQAVSEKELTAVNRWIENTLSTRKVDKEITPTILIMQRLHQNDPVGHVLSKDKKKIKHICIPGEIRNFKDEVRPAELIQRYSPDGLMDKVRMSWDVLKELEIDLGQYGYAGQIGQKPTPPGGKMFKVDHFQIITSSPSPINFVQCVRYWDKAGTSGGGAYTVGVKMYKLSSGRYFVANVKRGQWSSEEREKIIRETSEMDGCDVTVYVEQEPGSGGKESAEATIRNLAGYSVYADRPSGDKVFRADPYSVQVNNGNVLLLHGDWNKKFTDEHQDFPFSNYKDQVDAAAGAFSKLSARRTARTVLSSLASRKRR